MAGPGGTEVGRVSVKAVPDTANFRRDLEKDLKEIQKEVSLEVPVELDIEHAKLQIDEIKAELKSIKDQTVTVKINQKSGLSGVQKDLKKTLTSATALGDKIRNLFGSKNKSDLSTFGQIGQEALGAFGKAADIASNATAKLGQGLGDALDTGLKGMASGITTVITQMVIWVPLISAIIALVLFLAGAITALVGAIPALLVGIGAPIAAIVLGFDGIKKAAATLSPAIDALKARLSATFEKLMVPIFKELSPLIGVISDGLNSLAGNISTVFKGLVDVATTKSGMNAVAQAIKAAGVFLNALTQPLKNMETVFLNLASDSGIFKTLGSIFAELLNNVSSFLANIQGSGALSAGLKNVQSLLNSLVKLFLDLLAKSLDFFNGASPGFDNFLDQLDVLVNKIDFTKLGKAFGDAFDGISKWLSNLDPTTVSTFTQTFVDLATAIGNLLSGNNLTILAALFGGLIQIVTFVVNALSGFLTVLFNIASFDWGGLISSIGGFFDGLLGGATQRFQAVIQFFQSIPGKFKAVFVDAPSQLVKQGGDIINGLWNGVKQAFANVIGWFAAVPSRISGIFSNPLGTLFNIGSQIIQGLLNGLKSKAASIENFLVGLTRSIITWKGPPSTDKVLLTNNGQLIMQGLLKGLQTGYAPVKGLLNDMTSDISNTFSDPALINSMSVSGADISATGTSQLQVAGSLTSNIGDSVVDALNGWTVQLDQTGLARLVNKGNNSLNRRS